MADSVDQPPRLPSVEIAREPSGSKTAIELDLANPVEIKKEPEQDLAKPAEIENATEPDLSKPAESKNATEPDLAKPAEISNATEPDLAKPTRIENATEPGPAKPVTTKNSIELGLAKLAESKNATKPDLKNSSTSSNEEIRLIIRKIQGNDPDETALMLKNLTSEQQLTIISKLVTGIFWSAQCNPQSYSNCFKDCIADASRVAVFSRHALTLRRIWEENTVKPFLDMDAKAAANNAAYCVLAPRLVSMLILFLLHRGVEMKLAN